MIKVLTIYVQDTMSSNISVNPDIFQHWAKIARKTIYVHVVPSNSKSDMSSDTMEMGEDIDSKGKLKQAWKPSIRSHLCFSISSYLKKGQFSF